MSISLISEPQLYTPAFNPVLYVVSGTKAGHCDYQYICDVYVRGVFAIRLREFPLGDNDYGYFDISKILQDYLSHDYDPTLVGVQSNPNGICSYYVQFAERYGDASPCDGDLITDNYSYSASVKYAWNAALSRQQFFEYNYLTYVTNNASSIFLTALPNGTRIKTTDYFNLDFLQSNTDPVLDIVIATTDRDGTPIGAYVIDNTITAASPFTNLKCSVGVGPVQLNRATLSSGLQPVISSNVGSYTVTLVTALSQNEAKSFVIDDRCPPKYTEKPVWFWNRLGGFDRFVFNLKSTRAIDIQRRNYSKPDNPQYQMSDRGVTTMGLDAQEKFTFQSDWLTEDESLWLEELFTSPEAYLYTNDVLSYEITAVTRVSGALALAITGSPPRGLTYDYVLDGSSAATMGIPTSGSLTLPGWDGTYYITNIGPVNNASSLCTGSSISVTRRNETPLVITSPSYEEKIKNNVKTIRHTIEVQPAHKINIQNQ